MSFSSARQPDSATKTDAVPGARPQSHTDKPADKGNAAPTSGEQQAKTDVFAEKHWGTTQKYRTEEEAYGKDGEKGGK
ncbi:hypothetical protein HDU87_006456 [Geranomyces variabilis]|uniref:Uncharacterized protein n=1 Tax=Geranomyces variabilis TaxID=109894 RepID=A0AAD5TGW2_9FUNG|nr:hypothetical protein HDU87_006456 [Geranomyces variabilis]